MKIDRISRIGYSVALLLGMFICTGAYAQVKDGSKSSQTDQQTRTYTGTVVDENDEFSFIGLLKPDIYDCFQYNLIKFN